MLIKADTRDHISSTAVHEQVAWRYGLENISDDCALTIASWYAMPFHGSGAVFAQLATTGSVDHHELLLGIRDHARRDAGGRDGTWGMDDTRNHAALDMLGWWAIAKRNALQTV